MFQQSIFVQNEIYKKRLDVILVRLVEQGVIDYFDRKILRSLGVKDGESSRTRTKQNMNIASVTFNELKFMVIVMVIGIFASLSVFVMEIIIGKILCRN